MSPNNIILMGVSGCGKTSVGKKLAAGLGIPFFDGDDFHPEKNVEKMRSGRPLNDSDRRPWLENLAELLATKKQDQGCVLACSALKQQYRKMLSAEGGEPIVVYLKGEKDLISERLRSREGHYMPPELLDSQFNDLEEPESAIAVSINQPVDRIVEEIIRKIELIQN
ncbi:gluconokinase [Rhodohalobacter sp. SW132]|uniref:gluconokinase n=1 Tax=Rhodohalobacter sp. SW132 TaxID=2293433 RepID=UPI000E2650E4|nr:gluconokinase [Rhodohalobacter sp. SW132]REL24532.1 gluconokinase [Rhodohalobacter sp. SW132]